MTEQTAVTEIAKDSAMREWSEHYLTCRLSEEDMASGDGPICVVSHPDAGGPCERPAALKVYGLAFCETHGAQAAYEAVREARDDAADEAERVAGFFEQTHFQNELALDAMRSTARLFRGGGSHDSDERDRLIREAYPLIEERVDAETRDWAPGNFTQDPPVDRWGEALWMVHAFMRMAWSRSWVGLEEELEFLRERCAAQLSFALFDSDRKLGSREQRRKAREKAATGRVPSERGR